MSDTTARIYEKKYKVKLLINITEEQDIQLRQMAKQTGRPVSELIRDGIDGVLSGYNAHGIVGGATEEEKAVKALLDNVAALKAAGSFAEREA